MPGLVYYNGERLAPDRVRLRHAGAHDLLAADDEAGAAFAQLFAGTELRVVLTDDFLTLAWRKLFLNAVAACRGGNGPFTFRLVANPITALTLQRQARKNRQDRACAITRDGPFWPS